MEEGTSLQLSSRKLGNMMIELCYVCFALLFNVVKAGNVNFFPF